MAREEAPTTKPYSPYLIRKQGLPPDQPDLCLRPVIRPESGRSICGTSRPATRAGLSQSTKLRLGCECEFVIANCSGVKTFYGIIHIARHAYVPTHLAVKTKRPRIMYNLQFTIYNVQYTGVSFAKIQKSVGFWVLS